MRVLVEFVKILETLVSPILVGSQSHIRNLFHRQVSGVAFAFNPKEPPGQRVKLEHIKVGEEQLDLSKRYRMVSKRFVWTGRDGYEMLKNSPVLVSTARL